MPTLRNKYKYVIVDMDTDVHSNLHCLHLIGFMVRLIGMLCIVSSLPLITYSAFCTLLSAVLGIIIFVGVLYNASTHFYRQQDLNYLDPFLGNSPSDSV